jgi:hypothetical protein
LVPGCDRPDRGPRGLCNTHQKRLDRHGSVDAVRKTGYAPRTRRSDVISYGQAHLRIRYDRGDATGHTCVDEMLSASGSPYCPHPDHYDPRCRSCHRKRDAKKRKRVA